MNDTALEKLFDAAGLERELAQRWSEKARADGQSIDRALADSGVLDPITAQTFRTIVNGYASIDPSSIAEQVDHAQARLLTPPPPTDDTSTEGEVIHLGDSDGSAVDNEAESLRIDEATLGGALDNALNHALARLPPVPPRTSRSREARIGPVPLGFGDPTSWLGSKLGPYELTSFLGEGSTARAYEAKHSLLGVERIIKLPARGADANTILAEARLLERLAHPGVAPFVEYDVDKGTPFAVFRHRRGHSLSERLAMGEALSESELLKLAIDVCDVLEFCHSHSILHLDLKPANLFVTGERTVVLDFGIAAVREDSARKTHFYGTPQFAAPEQVVAPEAVDTRTDLYGLGMTLYAAAAGNLQNTHSGEGLFGHLFGSLRPLGELRSDLGESFTGLVSDLLKPIPGERPENATEVRHRLSKLIENTQQENQ